MSGQGQRNEIHGGFRLIKQCLVEKENEGSTLKKLYNSGKHSDVSFSVGRYEKRLFKAHRAILMAASKKFEELIMSHRNGVIEITDIDCNAFEQLLKVIYLNEFQIESFRTAVVCSKVFQEYGLPVPAVKECFEYMNHPVNLTVQNAITLYEANLMTSMGNPAIIENCLKIFSTDTLGVLYSVAFTKARLETILTIFDLPQLNISSEIKLMEVLWCYAKRHGALPTHNYLYGNDARFEEMVKPALAKIRLLTVPPEELMQSMSLPYLLTDHQVLCIIANPFVPLHLSGFYKVPDEISSCRTSRITVSNNESNVSSTVQGPYQSGDVVCDESQNPRGNSKTSNLEKLSGGSKAIQKKKSLGRGYLTETALETIDSINDPETAGMSARDRRNLRRNCVKNGKKKLF